MRDNDVWIEILSPRLKELNLPTDEDFIKKLTDIFVEASMEELVRFREEIAIKNRKERENGN